MESIKTNLGSALAGGEYLLWRFATKIVPILLPLLGFIFFFLAKEWTLSFLSLFLMSIILYLILREAWRQLASWDVTASLTLFTFSFLISLSLVLALSLITMRLEWFVLALFFATVAMIFLLFAYYFKAYR